MTKFKKIICIALSVCVASLPFAVPMSVSGEESVSSLEEQLAELEKQNDEYEAILKKTQADINEKEAYRDALVKKVEVLNNKIILTRENIEDLNKNIDVKQAEVDKANGDIEDQLDALSKRLRAIYMAGSATDLEIILGAKDFSDFLDKVELVKTLSNYDKELIDEIKIEIDKIAEQKKALEADKVELEAQQETLEADQKEFNDLIEENNEILKSLYETSDGAKNAMESAALQSAEIEKKLKEFRAQQQQQQQQLQQQQQQNTTSDSNGESSSPGTTSGGGSYVPPSSSPSPSGYTWPVPGFYYRSSEFYEARTGYYHGGIDIAGAGIMGATVVAASDGVVFASNNGCTHNWPKDGTCGCGGGFGNYVMIDHGGGKIAIYGHLTNAVVSAGQTVSKGQVIGYVGTTGYSTGPHLHFECQLNGVKYDPMSEY